MLIFGIVSEARTACEPWCVWAVQDCIFPLIRWSKTGSVERLTLGWEVCEMQRGGRRESQWLGCEGWGCMSNYLAGEEGERGAGQLEGEGRDLCHRTGAYPHRERQTGRADRNMAYRDVRGGEEKGQAWKEIRGDKTVFSVTFFIGKNEERWWHPAQGYFILKSPCFCMVWVHPYTSPVSQFLAELYRGFPQLEYYSVWWEKNGYNYHKVLSKCWQPAQEKIIILQRLPSAQSLMKSHSIVSLLNK